MRYTINENKTTAMNNSKYGGREESYRVASERKGRTKVLDVYPTKDMALKMYQTYKHELRENSHRNNGTIIKVQKIQKISYNEHMTWQKEVHSTIKSAVVIPYSKQYSNRMRRIRGF